LLLVQVDSRERSVEKIKERLLGHGFKEAQIAVHTAAEPDDDLLAIANDDRIEVLVFKMAVALGFDAPRAFTLVSMRAARDPDFGVQLIGRLLRVHRLLQGRAQSGSLPVDLNHGYVFLSDLEAQDGLDKAGQRINSIQTEYAKASPATIVLHVGDGLIGAVDPNGQTRFELADEQARVTQNPGDTGDGLIPPTGQGNLDLGSFFGGAAPEQQPPEGGGNAVKTAGGKYRYELKPDAPRSFKTQIIVNYKASEEDCAQRFRVSSEILLDALVRRVIIEQRTLDLLTGAGQTEFDL